MNSRIAVIGSGFSGLSAACYAAREGYEVTVFEKNEQIGGRARAFSEQGFLFDMGPSWYWMPDVFERFFADFGKKPSDYYELVKLDPGFEVFFGENGNLPVPADMRELEAIFESIEKGSAMQLRKFLKEAAFKYKLGMQELVYRPALSWGEYFRFSVVSGMLRSHILKSVRSYVRSYFKDPRLVALMEFPVLFLGAMPQQIPALYTLMNHAALTQGTWYPMGGMHKIVEAMEKLAVSLGVEFRTDCGIRKIEVESGTARRLVTTEGLFDVEGVIAAADYHHVEQQLLEKQYRNYSEDYWKEKTFAPSCLIYYIGLNKKVGRLNHHNLFFDTDFETHSREIYEHPQWPAQPLFYACCPSKTDPAVAPEGMENLFLLVPVATHLQDSEEIRSRYLEPLIRRMEKICGEPLLEHIVYLKSYSVSNFISDYNAYGGNAYGLANTLRQTAVLKPSVRNRQVSNLFYTGQLTVPGPGVPPALISGEIAARSLHQVLKSVYHENFI